ncbi:Plasmid stabilization system protein [Nitrospira sp. KM1]|uniref:type II toxin-antitoxin system RelE/ParE family toxin n=1 Tax=Nitrospira sp. KM1 TaxID=1936990 RepID=UPI0013A71AB9|nr:type II toxin-antitoxin system RelE/ParE family toxin [Nitrospira sp. KM1]BCA53721.1 Plasmid stabilization system protein [Nitrospira sp. KM1]
MSGPFPVRIVASAARAILEAAEWWTANRPKAPDAFAVELERAYQLLASQPAFVAQTRNIKLAGVRRIHLPRVQYYLYYRMVSEPTTVEILALWHTERDTAPKLS